MSNKKLTGSFVALITPFNKDGSVDFAAFRTLLRFHEDHGTSAILIMGSTGESSMLSPEEKKQIIVETAKMKTGRMPIFFGCTGNNTDSTIANVKFAKDNGISEADFTKAYTDFGVQTALAHADDLVRRYRIEAVPTFVIGGKYETDLQMAGGEANLFQLINDLAANEKHH